MVCMHFYGENMRLNIELDDFRNARRDGGYESNFPTAERDIMSAVLDPQYLSDVPTQQMSAIWGT